MYAHDVEIVIVGAGIAGIATAYYLCTEHGKTSVLILDARQPMSLTSAQSGENYRNWWPNSTMLAFTNHSIDLMERIAADTGNVLHMTRRGYALASRRNDIDELMAQLHGIYGAEKIRVHDGSAAQSYRPATSADWQSAPDGVDVVRDRGLIQRWFPSFDPAVENIVHIRRAGDISGQQLGQHMLTRIRAAGGKRMSAALRAVERGTAFTLEVSGEDGTETIRAEALVNAAGPFTRDVAAMLGVDLPVETVLQQKIAFEDHLGAISRQMPFAIDLDARTLDWTPEERELLAGDDDLAWLTVPIPGGIHCRPDGGERGTWIKLGWAYNRATSAPAWEAELDPQFPEIVLRGAAALNPSLKAYYGRLPSRFSHYGGFYTMTRENWPLIGPMGSDGGFVVGALSGFGTMAACAAGTLCAGWIAGAPLPAYAARLSPARYDDPALMAELEAAESKGVL